MCNNDPSDDDNNDYDDDDDVVVVVAYLPRQDTQYVLPQAISTIPNAHTKTLPSLLIESPTNKSTNTTNSDTADNDNNDPANNTTKTNPKEYDYTHGYAPTNTTHQASVHNGNTNQKNYVLWFQTIFSFLQRQMCCHLQLYNYCI